MAAWAQNTPLPEAPSAPTPLIQRGPDATAPGSIHGVVVTREGAVCEGAQVSLTLPGSAPRTALTDSNGQFLFTAVAPGPFQVTATSNGFAPRGFAGTLRPGQAFEAGAVVLLLSGATSEVDVSASMVEIAAEEVKQEETQRVLGVIPNFYVTYVPHAVPLTPRQKFSLAWKSSVDPITFVATGVVAGIQQDANSFSGYGQGAQGYAKRFGAGFATQFNGNMIGGAILPVWWKQDPRYFYKGTGTTRSRVYYALAAAVRCRGDNGRWQPNYSGIIGGLAAGGISNLYYPAGDRNGAGLTFENVLFGTIGSAAQNLFQEFIVRKLTPRVPNYGSNKP